MKRLVFFLVRIGRVLRVLSFTAPLLVILGWLLNNDLLKRLIIGTDATNPVTATLFIFLAVASLSNSSRSGWRVAVLALVFLTSLVILVQYIIVSSTRIDHVVFGSVTDYSNDGVNPMAPATAVLFILISQAKGLRLFDRKIAGELLLILASSLILFCLTGYAFRVPEFHSSIKLFPALQTCVLFLCVVFAILLSKPEQGLVGLLVVDLEGARAGRNLIFFTIFIPMLIAYVRLLAGWNHLVSLEMGVAFVMTAYVFIFTTSLFVTVASLNTRDRRRREDLLKINELNEELKAINNNQLALIEELAVANSDVKESRDSLQSTNDELLATNEKLEEALVTIKMQDEIIIEQKERALRKSKEYLEIIFSNTEEEIVLLDAEGKVVLFNHALSRFIKRATGKRPKVGTYVWEMTLSSRADNAKALFLRALQGEAIMQEVPMNVGGEALVHLLKYEPVWVDNQIKYVTIISLDITEQKRASEQLKIRVDQLQKTNYELDRFVYSVSHDLRAPLSSILGLVNVAELEPQSEVSYLKMIRDRIQTLDNFIRSILDYSRNSRTELNSKKVDFSELIEAVKENLRTVNGFSLLDIQTNIQQTVPFVSDPVRLAIIFRNLFSNAIRFRDGHKPKSTLAVNITCKSQYAHIIVSDNGIGIAEEHQHKVFDMFYRATEQGVGSGIGLYLVKETVTKLSGTIRLTSRFGEFTEFEIILPSMGEEGTSDK